MTQGSRRGPHSVARQAGWPRPKGWVTISAGQLAAGAPSHGPPFGKPRSGRACPGGQAHQQEPRRSGHPRLFPVKSGLTFPKSVVA
jgi:hypothetical protein